MKKICQECGRSFHGRSDKKYCSDNCRNAYHNQRYRPQYNYMRNINNALSRNRRVLERMSLLGKKKVPRDRMVLEGFDFSLHTNAYRNRKGDQLTFCYEYGYQVLDEKYLLLVKKELDY